MGLGHPVFFFSNKNLNCASFILQNEPEAENDEDILFVCAQEIIDANLDGDDDKKK